MTDLEKLSDRELDALVAEKVMGWKPIKWIDHGVSRWHDENQHDKNQSEIPHYSTDMAAAWTVVEKLRETPGIVDVTSRHNALGTKFWVCEIQFTFKDTKVLATDENSAPRAICLAALSAIDQSPPESISTPPQP